MPELPALQSRRGRRAKKSMGLVELRQTCRRGVHAVLPEGVHREKASASCDEFRKVLPVGREERTDDNVGGRVMNDLISRQAALEALFDWEMTYDWDEHCREEHPKPAYIVSPSDEIEKLPSAQPEVIRCKDCRWWDKYSETQGYCMAAKHGYYSSHWEIRIRRTYGEDFFCADAESIEEEEEHGLDR